MLSSNQNAYQSFPCRGYYFSRNWEKTQQRAQEPIYAVLTSDLHIGSTKFEKEALRRFTLWLRGKYGDEQMREIAGRVKYLLIAGDIVDAVGVYPGQAKELSIRDVHKQYDFAFKYLEKIPSYIEVIISPGNHDAARKALPQPAIFFLLVSQIFNIIFNCIESCTIIPSFKVTFINPKSTIQQLF